MIKATIEFDNGDVITDGLGIAFPVLPSPGDTITVPLPSKEDNGKNVPTLCIVRFIHWDIFGEDDYEHLKEETGMPSVVVEVY